MRHAFALLIGLMVAGATGCQDAPVAPDGDGGGIRSGTPGVAPGLATAGRSLTGAALGEAYSASGQVSWSGDGMGTTGTSGTVTIVKPVGANVRRAELLTASRGFSNFQIPNGAMSLEGTPISWDGVVPGPINNFNHRADVTNIVKPLLDPFGPGAFDLTISEGATSSNIDGSALYVVFNDPNVFTDHSVHVMFGSQSTSGENFRIFFITPFNHPGIAQLSLAIGFGFQPGGQFSNVEVNGARVTSCAGGQDDGASSNGALVTVGGEGDSFGNPGPGCSEAGGPRSDDELYDLTPFIPNGANFIDVFTNNPSDDDDIFGALLYISPPGSVNPTEGPPPAPPNGDDDDDEEPSTCKGNLLASMDGIVSALQPLVGQFQSAAFTIQLLETFLIPRVENLQNDQIANFISSPMWGNVITAFRAIFGSNHPIVLGLELLADQCGAVN